MDANTEAVNLSLTGTGDANMTIPGPADGGQASYSMALTYPIPFNGGAIPCASDNGCEAEMSWAGTLPSS
jgi:hypothetical protein